MAERVDHGNPSLTTIRSVSQFSRADESYQLITVLATLPSLEGILVPSSPTASFFRALVTAAAVGFLGAFYPAVRAGLLRPISALSHE